MESLKVVLTVESAGVIFYCVTIQMKSQTEIKRFSSSFDGATFAVYQSRAVREDRKILGKKKKKRKSLEKRKRKKKKKEKRKEHEESV